MATTFGTRPEDTVADSRGNVLSGVVLTLYPSKADAGARTSPVATVSTNGSGLFPYDDPTGRVVLWARDPAGNVWAIESEGATAGDFTDQVNAAKAAAENAATSAASAASLVNAPADEVMATVVADSGSATATALSSTIAAAVAAVPPGGKGVSRILTKLLTGTPASITYIGDSGLEGSTATAGNDCASRVKATLDARFGVTTVKNNRAVSGYSAYWSMNPSLASPTKFAQALADKADLYVIAFGHNDIKSVVSSAFAPGTGYPQTASIAAVEHMIRRIRIDVPGADIIVSNEWQYTGTAVSANTSLILHGQAMRRLAAAYGCGFVDLYGALTSLGVTGSNAAVDDIYIHPTSDTGAQHPNDEGHRVWGEQITDLLPADAKPSPESPTMPRPIYGAERYTHNSWVSMPAMSARTYGTDGYLLTGSWTGTATLPLTTSTATDGIDIQFIGSEMSLRMDTGAGQGHIKIVVDGATLNADLDLSALGAGQGRLPIVGLGPGIHRVVVTILSGSATYRGVDYLPALGNRIPYTSGLVTFTGTWTNVVTANSYEGNGKQTVTANDTVTVEWVGTALSLNGYRYAAANLVGVTTDGGTEVVTDQNLGTGVSNEGCWLATSGLPYGRHTTVIRQVSAGRALRASSFLAFDEARTDRPTLLRGVTISGEAPKFSTALPGKPLVRLTPDDSASTVPPYPTAVTSGGFTANGTATARLVYEAETGRVAY